MIYLATPYTHEDPAVMEHRYYVTMRLTKDLMVKGYHIFSPILHCHPIAIQYDLPKDYLFWQEYDKSFIIKADIVMLAYLDGWRESKGMQNDFKIARNFNKDIWVVQFVPEMNKFTEVIIFHNPWKQFKKEKENGNIKSL